MAIKFKTLNDKLENSPLTLGEETDIHNVEVHIDSIIEKIFNGTPIKIKLQIANFEYTINCDKRRELPEARRKKMYTELTCRYENAGWKCTEEISDYRDSNNQDYLVLTGKK